MDRLGAGVVARTACGGRHVFHCGAQRMGTRAALGVLFMRVDRGADGRGDCECPSDILVVLPAGGAFCRDSRGGRIVRDRLAAFFTGTTVVARYRADSVTRARPGASIV